MIILHHFLPLPVVFSFLLTVWTLLQSLIHWLPLKLCIMESFWLLPGSFLNWASTFVFNMLLGRITFMQIFYLAFSSMNIDDFSLKTASTFLLHLESFCWHDGRRAFKFVGQAWFTKKGSSTIQSHGDWQLCFLSTTQTIKKSTT